MILLGDLIGPRPSVAHCLLIPNKNNVLKRPLARHKRCDVYCGARETVGESSVSSGCWGEDSDHEYGWARRTPTFVAPIRFCS
jgi:hypothetical protein